MRDQKGKEVSNLTTPLAGPSERALLGCSERLVDVKQGEVTGVTSDGEGPLGFSLWVLVVCNIGGVDVGRVGEELVSRLLL